MSSSGYHKLDVYNQAHDLAVRIHKMTFTLSAFEKYEEGSQARRSSKRVSSSVVEGYALRKYKAHFLVYLYRALGSADETQEHLRFLIKTASLSDVELGQTLLRAAEEVSQKLARFIQGVEREHDASRPLLRPHLPESDGEAVLDPQVDASDRTSDIRHRTSED